MLVKVVDQLVENRLQLVVHAMDTAELELNKDFSPLNGLALLVKDLVILSVTPVGSVRESVGSKKKRHCL